MNTISIHYFKIPLGELILGSLEDQLCLCDWRYRKMRVAIDKRIQVGLKAGYEEEESATIRLAKQQLTEYLAGKREQFDVPILLEGTPFQKSVWNELTQIPFGKTETYLGLSRKLNNENGIRAVASANGANAISIFVPCHRIIGTDGKLVGYAGGLPAKKKLLQLEGSLKPPDQLDLFD